MTRLGINGFGRIGRCVLRALEERKADGLFQNLSVVAINEPAPPESIEYLARYDSTHGRFAGKVKVQDGHLQVNDKAIQLSHSQTTENLPWGTQEIDLLIECSGSYSDRATAQKHLDAGAKKLLFSQPAESDVDATIIYGLNHTELDTQHKIVSAGSCTTNSVLPPLKVLDDAIGIESVMIRTLHAAMNDQPVIDAYHQGDLRRNRAAFESMIPVETQLAKGIGRIMPHLENKTQASALRVPISDVSAMDIGVVLSADTEIEDIKALIKSASESQFSGVLGYTSEPLVSCDFVHEPHSGIVDIQQLRMAGKRHVKLLVWFDNEWGYANRLLDIAEYWSRLS